MEQSLLVEQSLYAVLLEARFAVRSTKKAIRATRKQKVELRRLTREHARLQAHLVKELETTQVILSNK